VRAAEAERAAAHTDATAVRHRIASTLARVERAEQLAATARRLSGETLGRLHAEYDIMVRTVSVDAMGDTAVLQIVEILEKASDTELQVIRADTGARTRRAELWRYVPASQFSTSSN
jgi:HEAT repeat protein